MTTTHTIRIPLTEAIRAALIELLDPDPYDQAATPTTLDAVTQTRRDFAERSTDPLTNPVLPMAPPSLRLAALTQALGTIGLALLDAGHHPDPEPLHAGLTDLAAVALAWLDTLPTPADISPHQHTTTSNDDRDHGAEPF